MPRTAADIQTELTAVQTEITRQLTSGQAYAAEGRSMQRVAFEALVKHRDTLQLQLDRVNGIGGGTGYIVPESG